MSPRIAEGTFGLRKLFTVGAGFPKGTGYKCTGPFPGGFGLFTTTLAVPKPTFSLLASTGLPFSSRAA